MVVAFQPHGLPHQRPHACVWPGLAAADHVLLTDIYAVSESDPGVDLDRLAQALRRDLTVTVDVDAGRRRFARRDRARRARRW